MVSIHDGHDDRQQYREVEPSQSIQQSVEAEMAKMLAWGTDASDFVRRLLRGDTAPE